MATQDDNAVVHTDADRIEGIAIADAIVLQLLNNLLLKLLVGNLACSSDLKLITHRSNVLDSVHAFIGIFFRLEILDRSLKIDDSIADRDLDTLEFRFF